MKWVQVSRALFFASFFSSCGKPLISTYNGQPVNFHQGNAEDVEESTVALKLKAIPEAELTHHNLKLLDEEEMEKEGSPTFNEETTKGKVIPLPTELTNRYMNYQYNFAENCSEANGMGEYFYYKDKVQELGGTPVFPYSPFYPESLSGFQSFLTDLGIKHFSAKELSKGTASYLKSCNLKSLLPPKSCWMRGAVLLLMAENIREAIGNFPLSVGSWYRPKCYNETLQKKNGKVSSSSDHLLAKAIDLFYSGKKGKVNIRQKMQEHVCKNYWNNQKFTGSFFEDGSSPNISIGMGNTVIHLGIDSPKGKRSWTYNTYPSDDLSRAECFSS